jgi:hypothetical protein
MAIKASSYKNWCTDNISPQAWPRILLKSLDEVRAQGFNLKELENPVEDLTLNESLMASLNNALEELYQTKVEEDLLSMY